MCHLQQRAFGTDHILADFVYLYKCLQDAPKLFDAKKHMPGENVPTYHCSWLELSCVKKQPASSALLAEYSITCTIWRSWLRLLKWCRVQERQCVSSSNYECSRPVWRPQLVRDFGSLLIPEDLENQLSA